MVVERGLPEGSQRPTRGQAAPRPSMSVNLNDTARFYNFKNEEQIGMDMGGLQIFVTLTCLCRGANK